MGSRKINREAFEVLWFKPTVSIQQMADAMGVKRQAVTWRARSFGLPDRTKMRARKIQPELFREMWEAGVSTHEIARHFGLSCHSSACAMARHLDLPRRVRGKSGKMNGGCAATITVREFYEMKLARRMAAAA